MNTKNITIILLLAARMTFAGEAALFELRSVAEAARATTKEYSLPARQGASEKILLESAVLLDAKALKSAEVVPDQEGNPSIRIHLTESGAKQFGEITARYVNKRLGIIVAGQLRIAPVVREPIYSGRLEITGTFRPQEAADLVSRLNGKKIR